MPMTEHTDEMLAAFERALRERGQAYLDAEGALRRWGPDLDPLLARAAGGDDPAARLVAGVLSRFRGEAAAEFAAALAYLDGLPAEIARMPIAEPPPTAVARYLSLHFGPRVADLLTLRLHKAVDWPPWRVTAVLAYLAEHRPAFAVPVLEALARRDPRYAHLASRVAADIERAHRP